MFDTNMWSNFILFGQGLGTAAILRRVCVCVFMCQPGVTWGGDRRMDRHILIAI